MRKLIIILSVISLFSFNALAQVSQETYQNARKINKEWKAKIESAEKEFKDKKATLDAELKKAQSEKPAELIQAEDEYSRLINENRDLAKQAKALDDSIGQVQALIKEYDDVAKENNIIRGDRTDLLKKVMYSAMSFPLRFRYSATNIAMTEESKLRPILGSDYLKGGDQYQKLLKNYGRYNEEIINIFKENKERVPQKEDITLERSLMGAEYNELNKENPMQVFKQKIIDEIWRSSYGREVLSNKRSMSIPYIDDVLYELDVRTNISKEFLQGLIDKLQPK